MTELIANGISKSRSASLTGIARSMIYYEHRKRKQQYDADLERRISSIVEERPLMCSLYHLDSYKREYIELSRYKGESRGGFADFLRTSLGTGDAHA